LRRKARSFGRSVFGTGQSFDATVDPHPDYLTIAYDAATGARLWVRRYSGVTNSFNIAKALAVSPNGGTVYVTGYSGTVPGQRFIADYVTIAHNAAPGARRWLSRYDGRAHQTDQARSIAVSPDGRTIYVTGRSYGTTSFYDYATVATTQPRAPSAGSAGTTARANMNDFGAAVVVAPGGRTVYVTGGARWAARSGLDFTTIAYSAATGAARWVSRCNGPVHADDAATSLAVTATGRTVTVTGYSQHDSVSFDRATVAYNAAAGTRLWAKRYPGTQGKSNDTTFAALALSPSGGTVFVTGSSDNATGGTSYATVAYSTASGGQLWASRFSGENQPLGWRSTQAEAPCTSQVGGG
jgi:WD40 repeat protein